MNPFVAALLVADVVSLIAWRRLEKANASTRARFFLGVQLLVALFGIAGHLVNDAVLNGWLFWAMLILLNAALAGAAIQVGHRGLAVTGGLATLIAVALVLAHSFSSVAAAGVATILCLGAALLPSGGRDAWVLGRGSRPSSSAKSSSVSDDAPAPRDRARAKNS